MYKNKSVYIPSTLNTICEKYNNGTIIWMSGTNFTGFQYIDDVNLNINLNGSKLGITESKLSTNQKFYNILRAKDQEKYIIKSNLINYQLKQAVLSASVGIKKYLLVRGVGYKLLNKKQYLSLQIGFSHKINILIPNFIKIKFNRKFTKMKTFTTKLSVLTGWLSAIRNYRKPDVYKGKGIRYRKDKVIRKEGKKKKTF